MTTIDRAVLNKLFEDERQRFIVEHRNSEQLAERAKLSLVGGVPMNWMTK